MLRVVIIEDEASGVELTCGALKRAGLACSCERVESEAAFREALSRSPDLVLADSSVPGLDGWEALAIVQAERPGTPFIFVAADADPVAARKAKERGATGFMTKSDLAPLAELVRASLVESREPVPPPQERRKSESHADASSTAVYLLERQAVLDRVLQDEDRSALSSILRRHPPVPVALLMIDADSVRERFVKLLENANIEIERATSTTDALARLEATTHALLFTERLELVQAARQLHAGSATHIVFLDVNAKVGTRAALRMGANDCMPAEASGEEFWAHLTTARRIASLAASLQLALTDNRILSTIDELTRCGSRRFFEHEFPREVERALRLRHPLGLVMCDIDHFKAVNDQHGHEVGDGVLKEFAERLTQGLRVTEDWVARVGGEEFAIVLPEVSGAEACRVAERLCEQVREKPFPSAVGPLPVTASFGVVSLEARPVGKRASPRALVRAADVALYRSKGAGRNRVTVARSIADPEEATARAPASSEGSDR
jgi:two-component system, cell cycle response regulator